MGLCTYAYSPIASNRVILQLFSCFAHYELGNHTVFMSHPSKQYVFITMNIIILICEKIIFGTA